MKIQTRFTQALLAAGVLSFAGASEASLTTFQTFTGNVGYSSDGFGSASQAGVISASVPVGSTVLGAYLYTSTYGQIGLSGIGSTLNGTTVSYGALPAHTAGFALQAGRADVTSIVAPIINGGAGGIYDFRITEASSAQDGEALVVVYSNAALGIATFAILDGFSASAGDTSTVNFATPLNTLAPGFFAQMFIGDGFSFGNDTNTVQSSTISVNGTVITNRAGGYDDGEGRDGGLITVGGFDDPFSPYLPLYSQDHEKYDLAPYVADGSSSIVVNTNNPSSDDNIFLAGFYVSGIAGVNAPPPPTSGPSVPEPATIGLAGLGLTALALARRKRK